MDSIQKPVSQFLINPLSDSFIKKNKSQFPIRACINIFLIFLSTIQVYILAHSKIYVRAQLVRSFLSIYYDDQIYPQLFSGQAYYTSMLQVTDLKDHLAFTFENIKNAKNHTFLNCSFENSNITLYVQYNSNSKQNKAQYDIDPTKGIVYPFDMKNTTSIQEFLLHVNVFWIQLNNISMNLNGFAQTYLHNIKYSYENQVQIVNNFEFTIDNGLISDTIINKPQFSYILYIRLLNFAVLMMAIVGLYLNFQIIRKTYFYFHQALGYTHSQMPSLDNHQSQLQQAIEKWIKYNKITISHLHFMHYFHVLEFDVIFSSLSNIFQLIGSFYLITGDQKERIVGIGCLFSWLTIFKFLKKQKKLILMYQLLKMSFMRVLLFFVEFLPVFISYALLGMCIFHKVSFFATLQNSVTTLVCLMMGDSIQLITNSMIEKDSMLFSIVYVFTFVLLFMHAIHNTLTSLIKQFFIMKKIQLIKFEKMQKNQQNYIYIDQIKTQTDQEKQKLPIKLSQNMTNTLIRKHLNKNSKRIKQKMKELIRLYDQIISQQKWVIYDSDLSHNKLFKSELQRRSNLFTQFLHPELKYLYQPNSLLTEQN